ncbi:hypothetical protein AMC99_00197 [Altererythrobacter epoxidivorans]|uniref:DUF3667 domain-containing protein n=1 Tax=Altererythrobacter epoxidivorans TaxID=361183 RepID=A0A0M4MTM7_9SPHN|nr:DUF3667 domain-containing protein [Altererythrobacter epoxidivorans]ALE15513.1 hypothetical protein AMC99_00197 [Altererythrobacter epoxidivorans]
MSVTDVSPDTEADGHTHEAACLNCGSPLTGPYCEQCGQRAHVHRTLHAFVHDLLHGVLHFEGKLWRTLPAIALRPGKMTREYIEGKRAKYISPIALYLFVVLVTFATLSLMGGAVKFDDWQDRNSVDMQLEAQIDGLQNLKERREVLSGPASPERDELLTRMYRNRTVKFTAENRDEYRRQAIAAIDRAIPLQEGYVESWRRMKAEGIKTAEFAKDPTSDFTSAGYFTVEPGDLSWLDQQWIKAKENPDLLAYKLQNTAYKFGWLLIPISAPLVSLLFLFGSRRYPMYDHAVFVSYSISVGLFLFLIAAVLSKLGLDALTPIPILLIPVHQAVHFIGTYKQRKHGLLIRLPLLYLFTGFAAAVFILTIGLLSAG